MNTSTDAKTDRIRSLNDAFRRTFIGGAVMITAGVEAMPLDQRRSLLQKIRSFDAFSEDNERCASEGEQRVESRFSKINMLGFEANCCGFLAVTEII